MFFNHINKILYKFFKNVKNFYIRRMHLLFFPAEQKLTLPAGCVVGI